MIERDAGTLLREHGPAAYYVALQRARAIRDGRMIDESRPADHWFAVKRRLAKLTGRHQYADSATRRLED